MSGEKLKVDGLGDKGNPRSQWGINMWQKVLSKLDFRPNNSGGRQKGRKGKEKGREEESLAREAPPSL